MSFSVYILKDLPPCASQCAWLMPNMSMSLRPP